MRLSTLIKEEHIVADLPGETLEEGVASLLETIEGEDLKKIRAALADRRLETADLIGEGVAIPHVRLEGLDKFHICIGNSEEGLRVEKKGKDDDDAGENKRVHLVFLILTPQTQITLMLQTLAAIARLCHRREIRQNLKKCKAPARILRLIEESDVEVKRVVTAGDAMRSCPYVLSMEADLSDALKMLIKSSESALPILNDDGRFYGVITPADMFKLGLPKYLDILSDTEFLTNFEPFEQVLANEKKMKAYEIASTEPPRMAANAPILQVAHLMVNTPTSVVFVVNSDGKLQGVIHERDILAKVLMP